MNAQYEITDIAHEKYSFLHRIRALQDIGRTVKTGDLGGFVENEDNLSFESGDGSWIFDDAIAAGDSRVQNGSTLHNRAVVCCSACVSYGSAMYDDSKAEDAAYIRGATLRQCARVSGDGIVVPSHITRIAPTLGGNCAVYGQVAGDIMLVGAVVVISNETVVNDSLDRLLIDERGRTILRDSLRDVLVPTSICCRKHRGGSEQIRRWNDSGYETCIHSKKRTQAPWRVSSKCGNRACLFTGQYYELPNHTICTTCPFYCKDANISKSSAKKGAANVRNEPGKKQK